MRTLTAIEADRRIHRASQVPVIVVTKDEARAAYPKVGAPVPKNLKTGLMARVLKLWRA
ncbi:hypothetical protein HMPREF9946_03104 [Acetobacteraceae bacterium AT-5844]|nr:hypothetical protein HMPREF9946_03104 [Acetobacteraceae bacterium AT-5844]